MTKKQAVKPKRKSTRKAKQNKPQRPFGGTIVFVPGYYGSVLSHPESGRKVWLNLKELLKADTSLALHHPQFLNIESLQLEATQVLDKVQILGPLLSINAYGSILKKLAQFSKKNNCGFASFAYDWRKSPLETIQRLDGFIQHFRSLGPVHLVAHSYGALMSTYFLRYGAQHPSMARETWQGLRQLASITLAAAPLRGSTAIFRNMHYGIQRMGNDKLLSPLAFSSFDSSYFLLPAPGEDYVLDSSGNLAELKLHDSYNWVRNKWGLFQEGLSQYVSDQDQILPYLQRILYEASMFHKKLKAPIGSKPPTTPVRYIWGHGHKTPDRGIWLSDRGQPDQVLFYNKHLQQFGYTEDQLKIDGDGTVTGFSSRPLDFFSHFNIQYTPTNDEHLKMIDGNNTNNNLLEFIEWQLGMVEDN